jgi:hypothetical protein
MRQSIYALFFTAIFFSVNTTAKAGTYYIDGISGNDTNNGKTKETAWKSAEKINAIRFLPGDIILFKRDVVYYGSVSLSGSGIPGQPITLGAYGSGKRPVIEGGKNIVVVKMINEQHWTIRDIETTGGIDAGIYIGCNRYNMQLSNFRIVNCYVHNVGDSVKHSWDYSRITGGIIVCNGELFNDGFAEYNSIFNNVSIENCTVRYIKRWNGISISSGVINDLRGNSNRIKNCTVEYTAADGIRMNGVQNSFIEYCVMYRNGSWPNYPAPNLGGLGAWFFNAENCTIQFCEASHVDAPTGDGGAFDIDFWQKKSTVQYCYGHNCHGYGVSVFGADGSFPTENSVVRYNIFSNNARDTAYAYQCDYYVFTWNGGLLNGVKIYNNTSYWNPSANASALKMDADFTGNNPNFFKNNIIYSVHPNLVNLKSDSLKLDNNIYWVTDGKQPEWYFKKEKYNSLKEWQQATEQDFHSRYADPLLINANYHDTTLKQNIFAPKQGSPAINHALRLHNMGNRDYYGNPVPDKTGLYDIGAVEFVGKKPGATKKAQVGSAALLLNRKKITEEIITSGNHMLLCFISYNKSASQNDLNKLKSQLVFINSMKRQYAGKGLQILLVCESKTVNNSTLNSFLKDAETEDIKVITGTETHRLIKEFEVTAFPTSFLIDSKQVITQRWDNLVLPGQLALAIENQFSNTGNSWSTKAQTIFPGFNAARKLSENVWLFDGGMNWKKGTATPARLLVLSEKNIRRLKVEAINAHNKKTQLIYDGNMEALPEDESKIITQNITGGEGKVFIATLSSSLCESGKYYLQTTLENKGINGKVTKGYAKLFVD